MSHTLILLRHGESAWNRENKFTGWTDVDLEPNGREQAKVAGKRIQDAGLVPDVVFTSYLKRAIRTSWIVMDELDRMWIPEYKSWRLNERHYGQLQGLDKSMTAAQFGEEQLKKWRRGYAVQPPGLEHDDQRHPKHDPRYANLHAAIVPATESLRSASERMLPYWTDMIVPQIESHKTVMIVAHGNTLRALVKHLDALSEDEVTELNIPVAQPLVYELDEQLAPLGHHYLASEQEIAQEVQAVIAQSASKK